MHADGVCVVIIIKAPHEANQVSKQLDLFS